MLDQPAGSVGAAADEHHEGIAAQPQALADGGDAGRITWKLGESPVNRQPEIVAARRGNPRTAALVERTGGWDDHSVDVRRRPRNMDVNQVGDHGDHRDRVSTAAHGAHADVIEQWVKGDDAVGIDAFDGLTHGAGHGPEHRRLEERDS